MNTQKKIILMAAGTCSLPVFLILFLLLYSYSSLRNQVSKSVYEQIETQLTYIIRDTYTLCKSQQEMIEQSMESKINVAQEVLKNRGNLAVMSEMVAWNAQNQFSQEITKISLPKVAVGNTWLGQCYGKEMSVPVVDDTVKLVGGTCTIFQRMNEQGDMLRVATNVLDKEGKRAIGTYIPAGSSNETSNRLMSTVLGGHLYIGRAFVVDQWYFACYKPLKNESGKIIGMLYVGVPENAVTTLRQSILSIRVGKTGYVYVLGSQGDMKGRYIISKDGKRDGENVWEVRDEAGNFVIQNIVQQAIKGKEGEVSFIRYPWKNEGENEAREKIAAITYLPTWDWVIGVGAYENDISDIRGQINSSIWNLIQTVMFIGILLLAISLGVAIKVSLSIVRPIDQVVGHLDNTATTTSSAAGELSSSSQQLSEGTAEQASSLEEVQSSLEEMSAMTRQNADNAKEANKLTKEAKNSANLVSQAMVEMQHAMEEIQDSSGKIEKIVKTIEEIASQTNLLSLNSAVEAARVGEHGKGFAVVAEEVRNLAKRSGDAAKESSQFIGDNLAKIKKGVEISQHIEKYLKTIVEHTNKAADLVDEIAAASQEQSQGIGQVTNAMCQIDNVTQQNTSVAEQAASTSEELTSQAQSLKDMVKQLTKIIAGVSKS